jgi:hypothetical protein
MRKRPRDGDGERFIHSAVQCEGGEVEDGRLDKARVVVTPWSYLQSGDKGPPTTMFHGWAAPMYNDMKTSNVVRVLEHKNLHK